MAKASKTNTSSARSPAAQARDLAEKHLQLVPPIARRVLSQLQHLPGIEFDDLIQAGMVGLLAAARDCDPSRPFKTYACVRIRGAILDSLKMASAMGDYAWAARSQPLPIEMPAPDVPRDPGEETELSPRRKRLLARAKDAVLQLDERQQQLLELVYIDGKSPREIAAEGNLKGKWDPVRSERRIQDLHRDTLRALRQKLAA